MEGNFTIYREQRAGTLQLSPLHAQNSQEEKRGVCSLGDFASDLELIDPPPDIGILESREVDDEDEGMASDGGGDDESTEKKMREPVMIITICNGMSIGTSTGPRSNRWVAEARVPVPRHWGLNKI